MELDLLVDQIGSSIITSDSSDDLDDKKQRELVVNWLELPDHILSLVLYKLNYTDYIRFGAVCHAWKSIYSAYLHHLFPSPQLPLLMFTSNDLDEQTRSAYNLSDNGVSSFQLPVPHSKFCRGCSHGWLVILDKNLLDICVFNPFLTINNEIHLPPLSAFKYWRSVAVPNAFYLRKAVVSHNPMSNPNFVVMAIYGRRGRLAFCKPGDVAWRFVINPYRQWEFENVIYFENQFYAVNWSGALFSCDMNLPCPKLSLVAQCPNGKFNPIKIYLVELCGKLLQVRRYIALALRHHFTTGFQVFQLDRGGSKWDEVKDLLGHALFIGDNSSLCISSADFPGCKPNCIYYTDDYFEAYTLARPDDLYDVGVFNLEAETFERHSPMTSKMKFPPPIWIQPTLV